MHKTRRLPSPLRLWKALGGSEKAHAIVAKTSNFKCRNNVQACQMSAAITVTLGLGVVLRLRFLSVTPNHMAGEKCSSTFDKKVSKSGG